MDVYAVLAVEEAQQARRPTVTCAQRRVPLACIVSTWPHAQFPTRRNVFGSGPPLGLEPAQKKELYEDDRPLKENPWSTLMTCLFATATARV